MRFAIWTLLVIIPLSKLYYIGGSENVTEAEAYIYDDELLKTITNQLKDLQETNLKIQESNLKLLQLNEQIQKSCAKMNSLSEKRDEESRTRRPPANCAEALKLSGRHSGIHRIEIPDTNLDPFYVYCLSDPQRGADRAWTLLLRRMENSIDFDRPWLDYQQGFGNLNGEFFLGLDKIHALTQTTLHELWIELEDFEMLRRSANYSAFAIGTADESYAINILGDYTGDAGDSMAKHMGMKFSTKDRDNDTRENNNCAKLFTGGWWYHECYDSHLTGLYLEGSYENKTIGGIDWEAWHGLQYSLKYAHMAIRPLNDGIL